MGLLETLQGGGSGRRPRNSITRHLGQLLRTSSGFGCVNEDYGVAVETLLGGVMVESQERWPVERLRLEILRNIERFEPDLLSPEVVVCFQDTFGNVHLEIRGDLADGSGSGSWQLRFSTWTREISVREIS